MDQLPADEFKRWLATPLARQILSELESLRQSLVIKAENSPNQENAYALLNQAYGVRLAVEQLNNYAVEPFLPEEPAE